MTTRTIALFLLLLLLPIGVRSQRLTLLCSDPDVSEYPILRQRLTINYNGSLPPIPVSNDQLTITENSDTLDIISKVCDESGSADIVICLDHSSSMIGSAGDRDRISRSFLEAMGTFVSSLSSQSRYCLLPFTDTVDQPYPLPPHPIGYYIPGKPQDSIEFIEMIRALIVKGNTYVDTALDSAVAILSRSPRFNRYIVLVTDDIVYYPARLAAEFDKYNIRLICYQVGVDNAPTNYDLARSSGGTLLFASDSLSYNYYARLAAEIIGSEHCTIEFRSKAVCPWQKQHNVNTSLTYNGLTRSALHSYRLGPNTIEKDPPVIVIASPANDIRTITVTEDHPCESGLRSVRDTLRMNFTLTSTYSYPKKVTIDAVVTDPMLPAYAVIIAEDSLGNTSRDYIRYSPVSDTTAVLAPLLSASSVDFGTHHAPFDTAETIRVTNINAKPLTVKRRYSSVMNVFSTNIPDEFTLPAFASREFDVQASAPLLGTYSSAIYFDYDTAASVSLELRLHTYGSITILPDTSIIALNGDAGYMTLRFDALPDPINLDTILFDLNFNGDMIEPIISSVECLDGSPLCNYQIDASMVDANTMRFGFYRNSESDALPITAAEAAVRFRYRSYLTTVSESEVIVQNTFASQGSQVQTQNSTIKAADHCGEQMIRQALNHSSITLTSVTADGGYVRLSARSPYEQNAWLELTSITGTSILSYPFVLLTGEHRYSFILPSLPSSEYFLTLRSLQRSVTVPILLRR